MSDAELIKILCPNPECKAELKLPVSRLGHNEPCPSCAQVITVVPIAVREAAKKERVQKIEDRTDVMPVQLVLENIRSLWNVGSIFRSCDGAGVEKIWLTGFTGRPPRKEISKTALGAEEFVPWGEAASAIEVLKRAKENGYAVVALEKTNTSTLLSDTKIPFPCILISGNEVAGLTDEIMREADFVCHLPMCGIKTSLNVAVASGVAVYELRRQYSL